MVIQEENGLLQIAITDENDRTHTIHLAIRSKQEVTG